jgi:WD40 repeat protein
MATESGVASQVSYMMLGEGRRLKLTHSIAHVDQVRTLAWCPAPGGENQFASCSDDGSVRVITITT